MIKVISGHPTTRGEDVTLHLPAKGMRSYELRAGISGRLSPEKRGSGCALPRADSSDYD